MLLRNGFLTLALVLQAHAVRAQAPPPEQEDDPNGREAWLQERFGKDMGAAFARRAIQEAAKERLAYPERFPGTQPLAAPVVGNLWRSIGPMQAIRTISGSGLLSGRVRTILPHPTDPDTLYLLTASGGLWKTTNFTAAAPTWEAKTDFLGSTSGGSMAFGRAPSTLYLGLGDPLVLFGGGGGTLLYSTNGGELWTPAAVAAGAPAFTKVWDLKVDRSAANDIVLVGTDLGLLRSVDAGRTYHGAASGAGGVFVGRMVQSLVQTSAGWLAWAFDPAKGTGALHLSTDQGATWALLPGANSVLAGGAGAGRATLGVGAPEDAVVYAFVANAQNLGQRDLFRSSDGGLTWAALGLKGNLPGRANDSQPGMDLLGGQAGYNHLLLVDPTDPLRGTVYLGGQLATAKSTDGGATWTLLSDWMGRFGLPYVHADCQAAAFLASGGVSRVYFGTDGGLTVSTDGGATWNDAKNSGLATTQVYAIACNPANPNLVLAGLQDNGTLLRTGHGVAWAEVRDGDGCGVGWSQANQAVALCSYVYNDIWQGSIQWPNVTWSPGSKGLYEANDRSASFFVTPISTPTPSADPTGLVFFTYTKNRVYRTDDGAGLWRATPNGIPQGLRTGNHGLAVSPVDTRHLAAAGTGDSLYLTTDGGATPWRQVALGTLLPGWPGSAANVAYADNATLYVCSEATASAPGKRVARSSNGGTSWAYAGTGLPDVPVTKLVVDPGDPTGLTVYAATWLGVYRTRDGGNAWSLFGTGLPQVWATDLYLAPDSSFLRVGTWGRGVWELSTTTPTAGIVAPDALRQGETALASVPDQVGATYLWTLTGGTANGPLDQARLPFTAGPVGDLTLRVQVTSGGVLTSTKVIPVAAAPAPSAAFTLSGPVVAGTPMIASTTQLPGCTYRWTLTGGTLEGSGRGTLLRFFATPGEKNVTVALEATNAVGQVAASSSTFTVFSAPVAAIDGPKVVLPGAKDLTARVLYPGVAGTLYAWTIVGGTLTSPANGPAITFQAGTDNPLVLGLTASLPAVGLAPGPSDTRAHRVIVTALPPPDPTITPSAALVSASQAGLTARVAEVPGGTYLWFAKYGCVLTGPATGPTVTYSSDGSEELSLQVEVANSAGLAATGSLTQRCVPFPTAILVLGQDDLAQGVPCAALLQGLHAGETVRWTVTGGTLLAETPKGLFFLPGTGAALHLGCTVTNAAGGTLDLSRTLPIVLPEPEPLPLEVKPTLGLPVPLRQGVPYAARVPAFQAGNALTWAITGGTLLATAQGYAFFQAGDGADLTLKATLTLGSGAQLQGAATFPLMGEADATITVSPVPRKGSVGLTASVPARLGCTYQWGVEGGNLTGGETEPVMTFDAPSGRDSLTVFVAITAANGTTLEGVREFRLGDPADDLDGSGSADPMDLSLFVNRLGTVRTQAAYLPVVDRSGDGIIDDEDVLEFEADLLGTSVQNLKRTAPRILRPGSR